MKNIPIKNLHIDKILFFLSICFFSINHRISVGLIATFTLLGIYSFFNERKLADVFTAIKNNWILLLSVMVVPIGFALTAIFHGQLDILIKELDIPLRLLLIIPIAYYFSRHPISVEFFLVAFSTALILFVVMSLAENTGARVALSYGVPITMSNIVTLVSISLFIVVMHNLNINKKYILFFCVAFLLSIYANILTGSRAPWLVYIMFFSYVYSIYNFNFVYKFTFIVVTIFIFLSIDSIANFTYSHRLLVTIDNLQCFIQNPSSDCAISSIGTRLWLIYIGVKNFLENILLGSGLDSSSILIEESVKSGMIPSMPFYGHLHNDLIEFVSQMGLIGLATFVFLNIGLLKISYDFLNEMHGNFWAKAIISCILIFLVMGLFQSLFSHSIVVTAFSYLIGFYIGNAKYFAKEGNLYK